MSEPTTPAAPAAAPAAAPDATPPSGQNPPATPPAGGKPGEAATPPAAAPGADVLDTGTPPAAQTPAAGDVLAGADDPTREGVPDSYTFDPPEGFTPNQEALDAAMAAAREAGLTQDQFTALANFDIERTQAANEKAVEDWNNRVQSWRDSARSDKDFGGADYDANVKVALTAVEKFGDADFKALLKSPSEDNPDGLAIGNHPAVLRFLHRIGKVLGDPSLIQGDVSAEKTDEDRLRKMYPSMFKESA